jgi:hypothetical protein
VPPPTLALDADLQAGDRQVEFGEEHATIVVHRVLVLQWQAVDGERRARQSLEPAARKSTAGRLVDHGQQGHGSTAPTSHPPGDDVFRSRVNGEGGDHRPPAPRRRRRGEREDARQRLGEEAVLQHRAQLPPGHSGSARLGGGGDTVLTAQRECELIVHSPQ